MIRSTLGLVFILFAMADYGLAQEGPPYPDITNSGSGSVRRMDVRKDQYGDAPWLKQRPLPTPNSDAWYRLRVRQDIEALNRAGRDLVGQAERSGQVNRRAIARDAAKAAKLSRSLWSDLQHGKSNRAKPESEANGAGNQAGDSFADIRALKRLIDDVTQAVADEDRTHMLDVNRRSEVLDRLEEINRLALLISGAMKQ